MLANMLRYIGFRLRRSWYPLVYLGLLAAAAATGSWSSEAMLRGYSTPSPQDAWHMPCLEAYGGILPFALVLTGMFVGWCSMCDVQSGFVKNLLADRRARRSYGCARIVLAAVASAAGLAVCVAAVEVVFFVRPSWLDRPDAVVYLAWCAQAWVSVLLCSCAVLTVTSLVRSYTIGMVASLLVSCAVGFGYLFGAGVEVPAWLVPYLPATGTVTLMEGAVPGIAWTGAALAVVAVCAAVLLAVVRRQDLP